MKYREVLRRTMRIGRLRGSYVGFEVMVFREVNLVSDGFAETAAGDFAGS